jgi:hypothetical protein
MGLINKLDDTKFRSLKWGHDRPGGGDSRQPYIKVKIDKVGNFGNQIRFANHFDDGLIRGGVVGSTQAAVTDLIRVGKFMTDFPKGPLFLAKQVGLQLSNPKIETGPINPLKNISGDSKLSGLINKGIDVLNKGVNVLNENSIGPTRIYNLGINTLAQVPVGHLGIHIERHGFSPFKNDNNTYYNVVRNKPTDDNRLVKLKTKFFDSAPNTNKVTGFINGISKILSTNVPFLKTNAESLYIDDYLGGPNSTYGIGRTRIRRYDNTLNSNAIIASLDRAAARTKNYEMDYFKALGVSEYYFKATELLDKTGIDKANPTTAPASNDQNTFAYRNPKNKKYDELRRSVEDIKISSITVFDKNGKDFEANKFNIVDTRANNFPTPNMAQTAWQNDGKGYIAYHNPQTSKTIKIKSKNGWKSLNKEVRIGHGRQDEINLTPVFEASAVNNSDIVYIEGRAHKIRDLAKFRIEAIRGNDPDLSDWMIFRAYLKGFTDNHNPSWSSVKYIGRGEEFGIYTGYTRRVSFQYKVAALSAEEMEPMYQKLNYLVSNTAPDYGDNGIMRGPMMRLTIGNYLYRQFGYIDNLTYAIADDSSWEIAIDEPEQGRLMYELPHIIDVNISFQILHDFLPQKSVGESPFIVYKPAEAITGQGGANIENPWLKKKENGKYTADPLTSKPTKK